MIYGEPETLRFLAAVQRLKRQRRRKERQTRLAKQRVEFVGIAGLEAGLEIAPIFLRRQRQGRRSEIKRDLGGKHGDDHFDRAFETDSHPRLRTNADLPEAVRELIGTGVELLSSAQNSASAENSALVFPLAADETIG